MARLKHLLNFASLLKQRWGDQICHNYIDFDIYIYIDIDVDINIDIVKGIDIIVMICGKMSGKSVNLLKRTRLTSGHRGLL